MRGYRMVIRTFHQPGANEPVDAQRLTSSSTPFVIQGQQVRWQAEIPYGHPYLSSTKANEFDGIRMMLVVRFWLFSKFLQVLTFVVWRHLSPTTHEILLCRAGGDQVQWHGEMSWLSHFIAFKKLKFCSRFWCLFSLSEWQVPLVEILTGRMMFRSNEISVLSLLRFYLQ